MTNLKTKSGSYSRTAVSRVTNYGYGFRTQKLSSLYNSRSTKYHSIYNSELFIITHDRDAIVAAGYHPLTKAIISLNLNNPDVIEILRVEELRKKEYAKKAEQDEKKSENLKHRIAEEAAGIATDSTFISGLEWAGEVSGIEKSKRMEIIFKELLTRNNITNLKTDFWGVFKLVKKSCPVS